MKKDGGVLRESDREDGEIAHADSILKARVRENRPRISWYR